MRKPLILMTARDTYLSEYNITMMGNTDEYSRYIRLCGGVPVTYYALNEEEALDALQYADGLLVTGGGDLDPALYGEENHGSIEGPEEVDRSDLLLYRAFKKAGKPILGICRGIQVIAAAEGVPLIQDIPSEQIYENHNMRNVPVPLPPNAKFHDCTFAQGTRLHEIFGDVYPVNSYHHQAVKAVPAGFKESARSADGLIEAFEYGNIIAVQWHPERLFDDPKHLKIGQLFIEDIQRTSPDRSSTI